MINFILHNTNFEQNFYTGRLRPEAQPLTLSYTIFHEKGTPSIYMYLAENFTSFLNAVNAQSFK